MFRRPQTLSPNPQFRPKLVLIHRPREDEWLNDKKREHLKQYVRHKVCPRWDYDRALGTPQDNGYMKEEGEQDVTEKDLWRDRT